MPMPPPDSVCAIDRRPALERVRDARVRWYSGQQPNCFGSSWMPRSSAQQTVLRRHRQRRRELLADEGTARDRYRLDAPPG